MKVEDDEQSAAEKLVPSFPSPLPPLSSLSNLSLSNLSLSVYLSLPLSHSLSFSLSFSLCLLYFLLTPSFLFFTPKGIAFILTVPRSCAVQMHTSPAHTCTYITANTHTYLSCVQVHVYTHTHTHTHTHRQEILAKIREYNLYKESPVEQIHSREVCILTK